MKHEKMSSFVKKLTEFCMKKRNNELHNLQTFNHTMAFLHNTLAHVSCGDKHLM